MPSWFAVLAAAFFTVPAVILCLDSLFRAVFLVVSWRPLPADDNYGGQPVWPRESLAVVIPAHNEAAIIERTLSRLQPQLAPGSLFVIADNCSDETAVLARQLGANVWERHAPNEQSKGAALRWFTTAAREALQSFQAIIVFDADSGVDEHFVAVARAALAGGVEVAQGCARPGAGRSAAENLAAYSEILSHAIDDVARERLGWPVPLRGRGMVFRRPLLEAILPQVRTKIEDVELSLLLAAHGRHTHFLPNALMSDLDQGTPSGMARQRARWLQGQRQVWRYHRHLIARLLLSGQPGAIALVFGTLLKPKTLFLLLKVLWLVWAVCAAWLSFWPSEWSGLTVGLASFALVADMLYYGLGLRKVDRPGHYARSLIQAPVYGVLWLWSLAISLLSAKAWMSTRSTE